VNGPRCHAELGRATYCSDCGWTRPAKAVPQSRAPTPAPVEAPLPSLAVRARRMAELRQILRQAKRHRFHRPAEHGIEVIAGHGTRCTCERCFAVRMKPEQMRELCEMERGE
jgi:hypothetical protein